MIESIKAASSAVIGSTGLEISLIGIIFIGLLITFMLVLILALWSSYNELARECAYLQKENFKLIQQNISKKVVDRMSGKR